MRKTATLDNSQTLSDENLTRQNRKKIIEKNTLLFQSSCRAFFVARIGHIWSGGGKKSIINASLFISWRYARRLTALFTFCESWSDTKIVPPRCSKYIFAKFILFLQKSGGGGGGRGGGAPVPPFARSLSLGAYVKNQ